MPIFIDFEKYVSSVNYNDYLTIFNRVCLEHGFTKTGIYCNASTLQDINRQLQRKANVNLDKFIVGDNMKIWLSGSSIYVNETNAHKHKRHISDVTSNRTFDNPKKVDLGYTTITPDIGQITNTIDDLGAGNGHGLSDLDYCFNPSVFDNISTRTISVDLDNYTNLSSVPTIFCNGFNGLYTAFLITVIGKKAIYAVVHNDKVKESFNNIKKKQLKKLVNYH